MLIRSASVALSVVLFALGLSSPAFASDIFDILERNAADGEMSPPHFVPYRHTVDVRLVEAEGEDHEEIGARLRIDPSQPPGERVTVLSSTVPPDNKGLAEFIEDIESEENSPAHQAENFWCHAARRKDGVERVTRADFTVLEETETMARLAPNEQAVAYLMTLAATGEASGSEKNMIRRLVKRLEADMTFDKPSGHLRQVRLNLIRPMRVMLVAKIKSMKMVQDCAMAPNGHPYAQSLYMHFGVSAFGEQAISDMYLNVSDLELIVDSDVNTESGA